MSELFLSQAITEEIKRKIAYSSSTYLANDVYFKMGVIDLFINSYGKDQLKEMLSQSEVPTLKKMSEKFDSVGGFLSKFYKTYSNSSIAKLSQDTLKDKELKKKDTFEYRRLARDMRKINCIRPEITMLYVFCIENTPIRNMSIPREYYKIIEHVSYKNISDNLNKRKVGEPLDATSKQI